ncbi:MAG: helicase, partial [Leptospiraceae bacterium]|nr:helicase [Leptospiraceae bacterium]
MLLEELNKLDKDQLARIAEIWGVPKIPSEKKSIINILKKVSVDEYYIKLILEKLTPVQVKIYSLIVASKSTLTLGEISRKVLLQPINVEKELMVIKHLMLVYQRKNRERITNNLDKYFPFEEIRALVSVDTNQNGEKFQLSIKKEIEQKGIDVLEPKYRSALGKSTNRKEIAENSVKEETLAKLLKGLSDGEINLLDEAFSNGGILEINAARVIMDEQKLPVEKTLRKLHDFYILRDIYFIDERFVRVLLIPVELYEYLRKSPVFPKITGVKEQQQKNLSNELDFVLNLKRLLLFISRKGLTLSQSERLKQADMKKSEKDLIEIDANLFPEKSQ